MSSFFNPESGVVVNCFLFERVKCGWECVSWRDDRKDFLGRSLENMSVQTESSDAYNLQYGNVCWSDGEGTFETIEKGAIVGVDICCEVSIGAANAGVEFVERRDDWIGCCDQGRGSVA